MAKIDNVINVSLLATGAPVARDNMNVVAVITSQQTGPLSSANRFVLYRTAAAVATDFGTNSPMYAHAIALFGTSPNPLGAGGVLVAGYWRGATEATAAAAAVVTGAQLNEVTVVDAAQAISDGSLDIDVDGTTVSVAAMDLRTTTSLADIVTLLDGEISGITGARVTLSNNRILVTSNTTGATSLITLASDPGTGTFIGTLLGLAAGTGAIATQGVASGSLAAESMISSVEALKGLVNFKGFVFIDTPVDADRILLAAWAQANAVLGYEVFTDPSNLIIAVANPVWTIKLSGYVNYRMLYSAAGDRKIATSYMARMHTVNFNVERSALTMHLKTLSALPESYTEAVVASAKAVGLDIYTSIKDVPKLLTSGANGFTDDRYNILAFIDAVQTDMFNVLGTTPTKIPQTQRGVNQLIDQGEKTTRGFVRAGVFAPGTWTSTDFFGDQETFNRQIQESGFYWLAGALADQLPADRAARRSPVLQVAVKNAGAIHSADIIINFNE